MIRSVIKITGIGFCLGGVVHWLIILGWMQEITPTIITVYFHSLAVLSPLAGIGIFRFKEWGRKLGYFVVITQIPSHTYMILLDHFQNWGSGVGVFERSLDLLFAGFYIIFFNRQQVKIYFLAELTSD
ncbi:hypothetical protein [uncultured Desulfobacter sp.]|uniref:hypothetical protein n=1 Tax=uncultured Desulfobacter sp. TaxID=240139 RepID=UPI0029C8E781|nr:hypothetical protein [uncultured Desulfobacter sp.]